MNAKSWSTRIGLLLLLGFTVVFCWFSPANVSASPAFQTVPPEVPANDNFADAIVIDSFPFTSYTNTVLATEEAYEPDPTCSYTGAVYRTIWYVYRPQSTVFVSVYAFEQNGLFFTLGGIYQGDTLSSLRQVGCSSNWQYYEPLQFVAQKDTTYYIQVGAQYNDGGDISFVANELPLPPVEAYFWYYPYYDVTTLSTVSFGSQVNDPAQQPFERFEWNFGDGNTATGQSTQHQYVNPGTYTVAFSAVTADGRTGSSSEPITIGPPPPLYLGYFYSPLQPSTYDTLGFESYSYDPAGRTVVNPKWDLGDGTKVDGFSAQHRYAAEGAYTVAFSAATVDGRTGTTSQVVDVENHDVAIVKITVPNSARPLQTKSISVGINSKFHDERVRVTLYKSAYGLYDSFEFVGELRQLVKSQALNKNTPFDFNYTFTQADAEMGKVTFKAVAWIENERDLLPGDNEYISLVTKVSGGKGASEAGIDPDVDNGWLFLPLVADK